MSEICSNQLNFTFNYSHLKASEKAIRTKSRVAGKSQSHNIFQPISARSNSTIGADEISVEEINEFDTLMDEITQSEHDLELESVTSTLTSHRSSSKTPASFRASPSPLATQYVERQSPGAKAAELDVKKLNGASKDASSRTKNLTSNLFSSNNRSAGNKSNDITKLQSSALKSVTQSSPAVQESSSNKIAGPFHLSRWSGSSVPRLRASISEDHAKVRDLAATRIQRFFRRHVTRQKSSSAALRRMLDAKRQERASLLRDDPVTVNKSRDVERAKIREEKARQARQQAIQVRNRASSRPFALCLHILCLFTGVATSTRGKKTRG